MGTPRLDLKQEFERNNYIAFLDVLGFSEIVSRDDIKLLETYFTTITTVLNSVQEFKSKIQSCLISDSIILIAPFDQNGFTDILIAVRRIQRELLWLSIILRGAISHGQVYYNSEKNIIVGKGYIRTYNLEKEAVYPRVIIDPSIINHFGGDRFEFLNQINGGRFVVDNLIYRKPPGTSNIPDDAFFVNYMYNALKYGSDDENKISAIYELIKANLYSEQKHYSKYLWLRNYVVQTVNSLTLNSDWVKKFQSL